MPLAHDLLEQAQHLANREPKRPRQASLRRAVSAAYYSVFHLLASAGMANWKSVQERSVVARGFDHYLMKQVSTKTSKMSLKRNQMAVGVPLKRLATIFVELQQARHLADYDYVTKFQKTDVLKKIDSAVEAFEIWKRIRNEELAQHYLVCLLIKERKD
jgi:uncharacterized protein (UPF0332 family)